MLGTGAASREEILYLHIRDLAAGREVRFVPNKRLPALAIANEQPAITVRAAIDVFNQERHSPLTFVLTSQLGIRCHDGTTQFSTRTQVCSAPLGA